MRSQKAEIDSLQLQLAQSAQKIRSSVERELRETFQTVKDERDQLCDLVKDLKSTAKDRSQKLAALSDELRQGREELQRMYASSEELKLELHKKDMVVAQEAEKVTVFERQLDTKSHHCNDLEREINHMRRKLDEQARLKKVTATQTLPDFDTVESDNRIACLENQLAVAERRVKDALEQLSRTVKERDAMRGQLNDVTENSSAMQLKLDDSLSKISKLEFDLKQSVDKISRLEGIISEKEKSNQMAERMANEMKTMISSLTTENAVLEQRIKQRSDDAELKSVVSSLEQKNSELTAQVCSLTEKLQAKLPSDRETVLQKDESEMQSLITSLQSRVRELEQELEKSNNRELMDGHDGKLVCIVVLYLVLTSWKYKSIAMPQHVMP